MYLAYQHHAASFPVLAFFLCTGTFAFLLLLTLVLLMRRRLSAALRCLSAASALAGIYLVLATATAWHASPARKQRQNYYCETGCPLQSVVLETERDGEDLRIVVQTNYDAHTPGRFEHARFAPAAGSIEILAEDGRLFLPATNNVERGTLRPGESMVMTLHFRVPRDVRHPRILVRESSAVTRMLATHD